MKILAKNIKATLYSDGGIGLSFDCNYRLKDELLNISGDYEITIDKPKEKRSLFQNAYLWELIGEISMKENGNRESDIDIYCNILQSVGAKVEYYQCIEKAVDSLKRAFRAVQIIEHREVNGVDTVMCKCFPGTSKMNKREMSMVIDKTIEYANEVGIDTERWKQRFYDAT